MRVWLAKSRVAKTTRIVARITPFCIILEASEENVGFDNITKGNDISAFYLFSTGYFIKEIENIFFRVTIEL